MKSAMIVNELKNITKCENKMNEILEKVMNELMNYIVFF